MTRDANLPRCDVLRPLVSQIRALAVCSDFQPPWTAGQFHHMSHSCQAPNPSSLTSACLPIGRHLLHVPSLPHSPALRCAHALTRLNPSFRVPAVELFTYVLPAPPPSCRRTGCSSSADDQKCLHSRRLSPPPPPVHSHIRPPPHTHKITHSQCTYTYTYIYTYT